MVNRDLLREFYAGLYWVFVLNLIPQISWVAVDLIFCTFINYFEKWYWINSEMI